MQQLILIGLNHKTTPIVLRERLGYYDEPQQVAALHELVARRKLCSEAAFLATCNRLELYACMSAGSSTNSLIDFLSQSTGIAPRGLRLHLYVKPGQSAGEHLFSVASGLDSQVLGEVQILRQVKEAFARASAAGTVGPVLSKLFPWALRAGKRARAETAISAKPVSISSTAVALAAQLLSDLNKRTILLIGAGKMNHLAARLLHDRGLGHLYVANRNQSKAKSLATALGAQTLPFSEVSHALTFIDVVISATSAPGCIITALQVREAMRARRYRKLILIDLAVPRDIDPTVQKIRNVYLYNLDDLKSVSALHFQARQSEIPKVQAIITQEADAFMRWLASMETIPTLTALRAHAERIRQEELHRALRQLERLSDRDKRIVEMLSTRLINKLLHQPTVRLKEQTPAARQLYKEALLQLFGVKAGGEYRD
ncbi:glutamyl-tRNA reductase [Candidatus Acetothermia bacterium]|nr:glutamyl-tRNA reductase [Candidatus Acetothermia bacterium]